MKKNYIKPCANISDSPFSTSLVCTSASGTAITTNGESGQGGTGWTGGRDGLSDGVGNGSDANDARRRFYSGYDE